jgi:hypothetical protein
MEKLPNEIYRHIYKYVLDLTILDHLRLKYTSDNYPDFHYRYENRIVLYNGFYHFIEKHFYFPSIVSCYWFDSAIFEINHITDITEFEEI